MGCVGVPVRRRSLCLCSRSLGLLLQLQDQFLGPGTLCLVALYPCDVKYLLNQRILRCGVLRVDVSLDVFRFNV